MQGAPHLLFTPLHRAEWAHALGQHQFRGTVSVESAQQAYAKFVSDESAGLWRAVPMPENAFELCADLAHRYASKLGIRTLDTLHVACAMELKAERFWTFDERQAKLAKAQGMKAA
jgi:predicted nucleic acid-binding protein